MWSLNSGTWLHMVPEPQILYSYLLNFLKPVFDFTARTFFLFSILSVLFSYVVSLWNSGCPPVLIFLPYPPKCLDQSSVLLCPPSFIISARLPTIILSRSMYLQLTQTWMCLATHISSTLYICSCPSSSNDI